MTMTTTTTMRVPPLVSVVMPCYNAAPFVAEAVESALAQTHAPLEVVVVDDASTDASWEVVRELAARHPERVRALRLEENRGGCHARNRGAALAGGEFLLFLDADDLLAPDTVAALVEAARAEPGALAVCPWMRYTEGADGRWREEPGEVPLPAPAADPLREWLLGRWLPTCALLWPRAVYDRTGGWDEALAINQDGDIAMRALAAGAPLARAAGGTGFYRTHGAARPSVSRSLAAERKQRSRMRVLEKLSATLEEQGRLGEYAEALGVAWHEVALRAFQQGHPELGRECQRRGDALAGPRAVSRTAAGRLLVRALGPERKERVVQWLARRGIMTAERRVINGLQQAVATMVAMGERGL